MNPGTETIGAVRTVKNAAYVLRGADADDFTFGLKRLSMMREALACGVDRQITGEGPNGIQLRGRRNQSDKAVFQISAKNIDDIR